MSSLTPGGTPEHSRTRLNAEDLRPVSAEKLCIDKINQNIEAIIKNGMTYLIREIDRPDLTLSMNGALVVTNGQVAQGLANVVGLTQPSMTQNEREARLLALIIEKTQRLLANPPPIVPNHDYEAHMASFGVPIAVNPGDNGLCPIQLKKVSEEHFSHLMRLETERIIREKSEQLAQTLKSNFSRQNSPGLAPKTTSYNNTSNAEQIKAQKITGEIGELLRPSRELSVAEIHKWIEKGLDLAENSYGLAEKLKSTGLISYNKRTETDIETGQEKAHYKVHGGKTSPGYFTGLRIASFMSWAMTLGLSGLLWAAAPAGDGGLAVALGLGSIANGINMGVQAFLKKLHNNTFENTWKTIQNELGTMDPKRAPALTGLMYLLIDKYSPVIFFKNQTKLGQWGHPTSTEAILEHLKEGADAALGNLAETSEYHYKGIDVKEKIQLAAKDLKNLEERWTSHWKQSDWWASTLTTVSFLGALGFGARAFL